MALLAAYDIVDLFAFKSVQVYTVGAPRPGNKAFADKYEAKLPDTWHVINPKVYQCTSSNYPWLQVVMLARSSFF